MFKKICFFIIAGFFLIAIYYLNYQTDQYNHTLSILTEAIENKEYVNAAKVFGGFFDGKSIIEDDSDKLDLIIYPGTTQVEVAYYVDGEKTDYTDYEKSYQFYLFQNDFSLNSYTYGDDKQANYSGIRFLAQDGKSFMYYFVLNDLVNSEHYVEKPKKMIETLLNDNRDYASTEATLGFININVTQSMVTEIENKIGGDIVTLEIVDNENNVVYNHAISMQFNDQFFVDCNDMITKYSDTLKAYLKTSSKEEQEILIEDFNNYYDNWLVEFNNKNYATYTFGYTAEELSPNSLYYKSIDKVIVYVVAIVLIYIILFHRYELKKLVYKILKKDPPEDNRVDHTISDTTIEDDMIDVDNPK